MLRLTVGVTFTISVSTVGQVIVRGSTHIKPSAHQNRLVKIQTTTVVRIYANTVVTFFESPFLRFTASLGSHPAGPFLYRSYIVLISFLYKNIRTI